MFTIHVNRIHQPRAKPAVQLAAFLQVRRNQPALRKAPGQQPWILPSSHRVGTVAKRERTTWEP